MKVRYMALGLGELGGRDAMHKTLSKGHVSSEQSRSECYD